MTITTAKMDRRSFLISSATVGGGLHNTNNGAVGFIGGGLSNIITSAGTNAVIGGGFGNFVALRFATVGGGESNTNGGGHAVIGGGRSNSATRFAATVAGGAGNEAGGDQATVGGGQSNQATGGNSTVGGGSNNAAKLDGSTVAGGIDNQAGNFLAAVSGGQANKASGRASAVAGGQSNTITAAGENAVIGGGRANTNSGVNATIPGGVFNKASGQNSFAAGATANADHDSSFVWGDGSTLTSSKGPNTFIVRATGGAQFLTTIAVNVGPILVNGSTDWAATSDSNLKTAVTAVDAREVLAKLSRMPVTAWQYKHNPARRYIGPMAQDFHAAFGLGSDDKTISTLDSDGVMYAAIQGLVEELKERDLKIEKLEMKNAEVQTELRSIRERLSNLPPAP